MRGRLAASVSRWSFVPGLPRSEVWGRSARPPLGPHPRAGADPATGTRCEARRGSPPGPPEPRSGAVQRDLEAGLGRDQQGDQLPRTVIDRPLLRRRSAGTVKHSQAGGNDRSGFETRTQPRRAGPLLAPIREAPASIIARASSRVRIPPEALTPMSGPTVARISRTSATVAPAVEKPVEVFT